MNTERVMYEIKDPTILRVPQGHNGNVNVPKYINTSNGTSQDPVYKIARTYDYYDESGELLYQVVRRKLSNPDQFPDKPQKTFRQRRPDGNGGWIYQLNGTRRVLYRLPELLSSADETVFICEGEKDVDRLIYLGLVATCNPMGAGKWSDDYNDPFRGREVVILPDNDQPGRDHAEAVAQSLTRVAKSIRVLNLPDLAEKGDVSDWIKAQRRQGNDDDAIAERLFVMADNASEWKPKRVVEIPDKPKVLSNLKEKEAQTFGSWDELNRELGRRIEAHPTAHKNGIGRIDCQGICHSGKGDTGLFYDPIKNRAHCNKGCTQETILLAFALPTKPNRKRLSESEIAEIAKTLEVPDIPLGNVLEKVLQKLEPSQTINRQSRELQTTSIVRAARKAAFELKYGFRRYKRAYNYIFNGQFWFQVEEELLNIFLGRAAKKLGMPALLAEHHRFVNELVEQFKRDTYIPELEERKECLVNFKNGTLEFKNGKPILRDPKKDDFLTYQLGFAYDPRAQAPIFQKFLDQVLPDRSLQMICAEFFGSCFTDLRHEAVLILYGNGANGKSTLLDIICNVLGKEITSSLSLTDLTSRDGQYNKAGLVGKHLNCSSELASKVESAELLKNLASGATIRARPIYGEPFDITKLPRFAFACNELPKNPEQTDGYFRRFLIVPFEQKVYLKSDRNKPAGCLVRDDTLVQRISEQEPAGVLNWILDGMQRLILNREFTYSEASEKAGAEYREDSDSVRSFLQDEGYRKPTPLNMGEKITGTELYKQYFDYCKNTGSQAVKRNTLYRRVEAFMGQKIDRSSGKREFTLVHSGGGS